MIGIVNEQMLPFSKIPAWCEQHLGNQVNRQLFTAGEPAAPEVASLKPFWSAADAIHLKKHCYGSLIVPPLPRMALTALSSMLTSANARLRMQRRT